MRVIRLRGTPYEMGVQHGCELKELIHALASERLEIACQFANERGVFPTRDNCLELAARHLPFHQEYSPDVLDELRGIADGAELLLEEVFFANALTDFQDVLWQSAGVEVHGCTSFVVGGDATDEGGPYIGQTWDMHASAEQFIMLFRREPADGPTSLTMTTAGCLSLVGVNNAGVAAGNNNLRPTDARPGVIYLAMLHQALRQTDWNRARRAITDADRASGHNYYLAHESGARSNIETTATCSSETEIATPWYVHTNHYLSPDLQSLEDPELDRRSTEHRLRRATERFRDNTEALTPERLRQLLSDHDGDELCICRHGEGRAARSCAFVVADPVQRCLWTSLGPPCEGSLQRFSLAN